MMILSGAGREHDLSSLRRDTEPEYDSSSELNVDQAENDTEEAVLLI